MGRDQYRVNEQFDPGQKRYAALDYPHSQYSEIVAICVQTPTMRQLWNLWWVGSLTPRAGTDGPAVAGCCDRRRGGES
jgi:hypothetical protein